MADYVDALAELFDTVLNSILDRFVIRRPCASVAWFDQECRLAKRRTRRPERAYAAALRRRSEQSHH
jgi:hypothetical protein